MFFFAEIQLPFLRDPNLVSLSHFVAPTLCCQVRNFFGSCLVVILPLGGAVHGRLPGGQMSRLGGPLVVLGGVTGIHGGLTAVNLLGEVVMILPRVTLVGSVSTAVTGLLA